MITFTLYLMGITAYGHNDEFFKPFGHGLTQNESNGMLILNSGEKSIILAPNIADRLGLGGSMAIIPPNVTLHGVELPDLVPYKELCIHLDQISAMDIIQLESPSTLLRAIPVKDEKYNSGRTESFSTLQYKKLKLAIFSDLKISVLDVNALSTIIIEVLFGDAPVDAFEILPCLSIKWFKKQER